MRKTLIEMGNGTTYAARGVEHLEIIQPKGATVDVLAMRQARRDARYQARRWRWVHHGLIPGIEIHTV